MLDEINNYIRAFRKSKKYTQSDFANKLGLSVRQVSYFESDGKNLKNDQLAVFLEQFNDEIDIEMKEKILQYVSTDDNNKHHNYSNTSFVSDAEFATQQEEYLELHRGEYSIWMFNMADIAMLNSQKLEKAWTNNIKNGINYSVFWDLSYPDGYHSENFTKFIKACKRILDCEYISNKSNSNNNQTITGIDVYGIYHEGFLKSVLQRESILKGKLTKQELSLIQLNENTLLKQYLEFWKNYKLDSNELCGRLRVHIPFAEEDFLVNKDYWRLFKDSLIKRAGTVLYKSEEISKGRNIAVLEPQDPIRNFFEKEELNQGFLFLGETTADYFSKGVNAFEPWFADEFDSKEAIGDFEKKYNTEDLNFLLIKN